MSDFDQVLCDLISLCAELIPAHEEQAIRRLILTAWGISSLSSN